MTESSPFRASRPRAEPGRPGRRHRVGQVDVRPHALQADRGDLLGLLPRPGRRRRERPVRQRGQLRRGLHNLRREGSRAVHVLRTPEQVAAAAITRTRLFSDLRHESGPFDVIGDVHGCRAELEQLLTELGYTLERDAACARPAPATQRAGAPSSWATWSTGGRTRRACCAWSWAWWPPGQRSAWPATSRPDRCCATSTPPSAPPPWRRCPPRSRSWSRPAPEAAEGLQGALPGVGALLERTRARLANAEAFTAAYLRYCWATDGLAGVRVAPFQLLASEGAVYHERPHLWHLGLADRLAAAAPELIATTRRVEVETGDPASVAAATRWWEDLTAAGGVRPRRSAAPVPRRRRAARWPAARTAPGRAAARRPGRSRRPVPVIADSASGGPNRHVPALPLQRFRASAVRASAVRASTVRASAVRRGQLASHRDRRLAGQAQRVRQRAVRQPGDVPQPFGIGKARCRAAR